MTDKAFERANQIKDDLFRLGLIKIELKKNVHISINLSAIESIRKPFIDAVDKVIAELKQEYENL